MVRINRNFTIDADLLESLQKVNASELINELLHKHFDGGEGVESIVNEIEKRKLDLTHLEKKLENLKKTNIKSGVHKVSF